MSDGPQHPGTAPAQPIPPEVMQRVGTPGGPATPFEQSGHVAGLPFAKAESNGANHAVGQTGYVPKNPPRTLTTPGVLSGVAGARPPTVAAMASSAAPTSAAPHAPATSAAPHTPATSAAPHAPATSAAHAPPPVVSPQPISDPITPDTSEEIAPTADPASRPPGARAGDHPLATTNSPWEQTKTAADLAPPAEMLPSAQIISQAPTPEPAPVASPAVRSGTSRLAMTIGLAVAAIALIATVVYLTMMEGPEESAPADIKVGAEQREYGDDPVRTPPVETAKPTAKPVAPPPAQPQIKQPTVPVKPNPRKPAEDVYEDL